MEKPNVHRIRLGDKEIEALINGEKVFKTLCNGEAVEIQQSMLKDMAASLLSRDKEIFSKLDIASIKASTKGMVL